MLLSDLYSGLIHLLYPHSCNGCGSDLLSGDNLLCLRCTNNLPHTGFEKAAGNPAEKIFWGRLPLEAAHSEFYFGKDGLVQTLVHQLKYKGNTAIGTYLGELMGHNLLASDRFTGIDALVPLPLFADRERRRGYNQAAILCQGMSAVLGTPVITGQVIRRRATETQTRKHRTSRWENVAGSFVLTGHAGLEGKHIVLVDDVITTGATLEACGSVLLEVSGLRLSIVTMAMATK